MAGRFRLCHVTTFAWILLSAALCVSGLDWWAVIRGSKNLEYICKPSAAILFAVTALAVDAADRDARLWVVLALVWCVAGDVFLMLPRDTFVPGLASFAVAQVLFTISFVVREPTPLRWVIGLAVIVPGSVVLARRFLGAVRLAGLPALVLPVGVYIAVISAMAVSSVASGTWVAIAGAVLFMMSDSLIAEQRFVAGRPWQPVAIIVSYHVALAGLVVGLV